MKKETARTVRAFAIELAIYAVLVIAYFFLVLHLLGQWLYELETHRRNTYAALAILLIIGDHDNTAPGKQFAPPEIRAQLGNYPVLAKAAVKRFPHGKLIEFADLGPSPAWTGISQSAPISRTSSENQW